MKRVKRFLFLGALWCALACPTLARAAGEGVQEFFDAFWTVQASNDASEWAGFFAPSSRYQYVPGGAATRLQVANDREKLVARYPLRIYQQIGDPQVTTDGDDLRVRYGYSYKYEGGRRRASGETSVTLTLRRVGGRWAIVGFKEAVSRN